jgi:predicted MFS family arabinose efflux permease
VCDAARAVALGSLFVALTAGRLGLVQIAVVAFVEGAFNAVFNPAETAAVRQVVPPEQLPSALAGNEARMRGGIMAGRPLGGLLFGISRSLPFVADACSYVVSLVAVALTRSQFQGERTTVRQHLAREVWEGVLWLWRQAFLRTALLLVAGSNFLFQALVLVLIVSARRHGASSALIGLMLAGSGLGGLLGSLAAPTLQRRIDAKAIVVGANWIWAALMPAIAFVTNPYALGAIFAAMAFVGPLWNVIVGAYELALVPEPLLGRVMSVDNLIAFSALPLGSLAGGFLLEAFGARPTALTLAASLLVLDC